MILSASRRTDIPAYYSEWFVNRLKEKCVLIPNPHNPNKLSRVELSPDNVDCIAFWTKNPAPILDKLDMINKMGYSFYFQFTLTPYDQSVERRLPPKSELLQMFRRLSSQIGSKRVIWRYDPILITENFSVNWHLERFRKLCGELHDVTSRCVFSFIDNYEHLENKFREMTQDEILTIAEGFSKIAADYHLPLFTCAEKIDLSCFQIGHSACIDQKVIEQIIGCPIRAKKDTGQRPACGCIESVDIGVYDTCQNGCTYCYATTSERTAQRRAQAHNPMSPMLTGIPRGDELITDRKVLSQKITQLSLF